MKISHLPRPARIKTPESLDIQNPRVNLQRPFLSRTPPYLCYQHHHAPDSDAGPGHSFIPLQTKQARQARREKGEFLLACRVVRPTDTIVLAWNETFCIRASVHRGLERRTLFVSCSRIVFLILDMWDPGSSLGWWGVTIGRLLLSFLFTRSLRTESPLGTQIAVFGEEGAWRFPGDPSLHWPQRIWKFSVDVWCRLPETTLESQEPNLRSGLLGNDGKQS